MTRVLRAFDAWVDSGPFARADLGRYRVVFAVFLLINLPSFDWLAGYPDSLFTAPVGPFMLLDGFPSRTALLILEITLALALAALALGVLTPVASVTASVLLLVGSGLSFSLGKIDHTIFLVLTPAVLALGGWGRAASVDALRRPRIHARQPQWPLRLLALMIGAGFITAAMPKALSGWLSPSTQAVHATMLRQYYVNDRTELLAGLFVHLDSRLFWEAMDWAAVLLELVVIVTVLNWRAFRCALAMLALFHVGVYFMMNIVFAGNVLVYGAFVAWSRLPLPGTAPRLSALLRSLAWPAVAGMALLSWGASQVDLRLFDYSGPVVLAAGGVVSLIYLSLQARILGTTYLRWRQHRAAGDASAPAPATIDLTAGDRSATARAAQRVEQP